MVRTGPTRPVDEHQASQRLRLARAYREAAEAGYALLDEGEPGNPVVSNAILSAVAYADAVTARYLGEVNQQDHSAAPKLLRKALGAALPRAQERRLSQLLQLKDTAQYGSRIMTREQARSSVEALGLFAAWAEERM
jgi:hypothetical protein